MYVLYIYEFFPDVTEFVDPNESGIYKYNCGIVWR